MLLSSHLITLFPTKPELCHRSFTYFPSWYIPSNKPILDYVYVKFKMQLKIDQFLFNNSQLISYNSLWICQGTATYDQNDKLLVTFLISLIWMQVLQHSFDTFIKKLPNMERKETDNINLVGSVNYKGTTMFCMF